MGWDRGSEIGSGIRHFSVSFSVIRQINFSKTPTRGCLLFQVPVFMDITNI